MNHSVLNIHLNMLGEQQLHAIQIEQFQKNWLRQLNCRNTKIGPHKVTTFEEMRF